VQGKISIPFEMLKNDGIRENKYFQVYVCCTDTGDPLWLLVKSWHLVYTVHPYNCCTVQEAIPLCLPPCIIWTRTQTNQ
jgi:hypothetical protein